MRIINVSPTMLGDVLACETRGWVKHVKGYTSKGDAIKALAGQGIHAGIAAYLNPDGGSASAGMAAFHEVYDAAFARIEPDQLEPSLTPQNLEKILQRWIEMHPPQVCPWKRVVTVEVAKIAHTWTIGDNTIQLICRPDIVVEDYSGLYRWVDTKTTSWRISDNLWQRQLKLSVQTALYTYALQQWYGVDKVALGGWINAIELRNVPASERMCRDHKVLYAECGLEHLRMMQIECMLTESRIEEAISKTALMGVERFLQLIHVEQSDTLAMDGASKDSCKFCPASLWCETGRYDAALGDLLYHAPWVIEEGGRL